MISIKELNLTGTNMLVWRGTKRLAADPAGEISRLV
jgi:hypothetical protein